MTTTLNELADGARPDYVRRAHVVAACVPGMAIRECRIDAPLDAVWAVASDLERALPGDRRLGRQYRVDHGARGRAPQPPGPRPAGFIDDFDTVLRPGWCWMQGRYLCAGMAATADGDRTRLAYFGGLRVPGRRASRPITGWQVGRTLRRLSDRTDRWTAERARS